MKRILAFAIFAALGGCGVWSSTIRSDVLDYSNAIQETTDKLLLVNILEASDNAPIHFIEMPKINGSLQATASLSASIPFFPRPVNHGTSVLIDSLSPTVSVQSTPNFEVDNLDTKDFATGITSPLDPKQVQYWFDRGLDHRLLFDLFFSSIQITYHSCAAPDEVKKPNRAIRKRNRAEYDLERREYETYLRRYEGMWGRYKSCLAEANRHIATAAANRNCTDASTGALDGECFASYLKKNSDAYLVKTRQCEIASARKDARSAREATYDCLNAAEVIRVQNSPRDAANKLDSCRAKHSATGDVDTFCHAIAPLEYYLKIANFLNRGFTLHTYGQRALLGEAIPISARELSKFDPAKYSLEYISDKKGKGGQSLYNIYSVSTDRKITLCFAVVPLIRPADAKAADGCLQDMDTDRTKFESAPNPDSNHFLHESPTTCTDYPAQTPETDQDEYCHIYLGYLQFLKAVGDGDEQAIAEMRKHYSVELAIRSAGEIVRYLGDLVYYQELIRPAGKFLNNPITASYDSVCHDAHPNNPEMCVMPDGGYVFALNARDRGTQFSVDYRGRSYSVAEASQGDHTLEVLSVVSHAINLNKSATDIRTTPVIQVVP